MQPNPLPVLVPLAKIPDDILVERYWIVYAHKASFNAFAASRSLVGVTGISCAGLVLRIK